ncbi:MAG: ROK family protein [Lachnospiraceae bacterium]
MHFILVSSNSIGGAMIIDNAIYEGDSLKGGEIGHMTVVPEGGELCYCGKRGCFDTLCRAGNLDQLYGWQFGSIFPTSCKWR